MRKAPLRDLLEQTRDFWDHDHTRPSVREAFDKTLKCGTSALGAEVFAPDDEERTVYHTCKSRACPSCGYRATQDWFRNLWCELPEVPYLHVCLTMPDVLWPLFQRNRHLLHDLPVLGARVLQQCARRYGIEPYIVVIPHTFGRKLNFNCHLHILVSEGGLQEDRMRWHPRVPWSRDTIMGLWRYAVIRHLSASLKASIIESDESPSLLQQKLDTQSKRRWIIHAKRLQTKTHVLAYAGRYARRPPIAQHRFRHCDRQSVRFVSKDTRTKRVVVTDYQTADFLRLLADHTPDRYRHNVRYFGLLAPRAWRARAIVLKSLGQHLRRKPKRRTWAAAMLKSFGINPLVDRAGKAMRWVRRVPSIATRHCT